MRMQRHKAKSAWGLCLVLAACASGPNAAPQHGGASQTSEKQAAAVEAEPPKSGPTPELHFPTVVRDTTADGLEINAVELTGLPVVDLKLVIRSGSASDPQAMPGTAQLVAAMLKEGTKSHSSAEIAEQVDYLGARLWVDNDKESIYIQMRALAEHLDNAMGLIADLAMRPAFSASELKKLKKRELDRLALSQKDPDFLASREFLQRLYGEHPYNHMDTTPEVVRRTTVGHLRSFHRANFMPNNAYLVAAGAVTPEQVKTAAAKAFKGWRPGKAPESTYPTPPTRSAREVVIVDRPESVQSVIYVGNLALSRQSEDYIPLLLANQVLGGSAASRLFMDLREKQSLTYGAYSVVYEYVDQAPFRAYAAVRNEVTPQAMSAFIKHLSTIRTEAPPAAELQDAKRFLVDKLPLRLDTAVKVVELVSDLRMYGLPDDYWETFRDKIEAVSAEQALAAAQKYIKTDDALIVVVGRAAAVQDALAEYGPVTVIDPSGKVLSETAAKSSVAASADPQTAPDTKGKPAKMKSDPQPDASDSAPAEAKPGAETKTPSNAKLAPAAAAEAVTAKASQPKKANASDKGGQ